MTAPLSETFRLQVEAGALKSDSAQFAAVEQLDELRSRVQRTEQSARTLSRILRRSKDRPEKGLYLWGKVGRGKSMLMDMFHEAPGTERKLRIHFLDFMQRAHEALHEVRRTEVDDAIPPVARRFAEQARILCLDEMQIDDIADAMIVGRLFDSLNMHGTIVCTTSNSHPDELYKDGLNRHLFEPFVNFLKENMVVHELAGPTDYRRDMLRESKTYFTPADGAAEAAINGIWDGLSGGRSEERVLNYKGREVRLPRWSNGIARFSFWELCGQPLGPGDFLTIASSVRLLILEDIPFLGRSNYNEAKRFVMLVDALYEARVQLVASAAAEPESLYVEGGMAFLFERAASRMREMQSEEWQTERNVGP